MVGRHKIPEIHPGKMPFELNEETMFIFGMPNFRCIPIVEALRRTGHDIMRKAEVEQACAIYWMLGMYLEHGTKWAEEADKFLAAKQ